MMLIAIAAIILPITVISFILGFKFGKKSNINSLVLSEKDSEIFFRKMKETEEKTTKIDISKLEEARDKILEKSNLKKSNTYPKLKEVLSLIKDRRTYQAEIELEKILNT